MSPVTVPFQYQENKYDLFSFETQLWRSGHKLGRSLMSLLKVCWKFHNYDRFKPGLQYEVPIGAEQNHDDLVSSVHHNCASYDDT